MLTRLHVRLFLPLATLLLSASVHAQCNDCWLETRGTEIVNASTGKPVKLRTIGLGYWLLQEGYMLNPGGCDGCPGTQWQMKRQYRNEGLSMAEIEAFYRQWRDTFITKGDIDFIASLGFNSVRLPMHYDLFLTDSQRAVRNNVMTNTGPNHDFYKAELRRWLDNGELFVREDLEGFRMIDRLVEWCEANGMYVILDLHAAPGSQGSDLNISDGFYANNLWEFPVFQDAVDRLWLSISNRYKDEPRIAMYEFFNEPNNVPGGGQAIHALTQRVLTTVRNNGDNHIIGIHGDGWGNVYDFLEPSTLSPNWGLVYSAHRYWIDPADDWVPNGNPNAINRMVDLINFRDTHNVPVWVGETGENSSDWLIQNIEKLENAGVGWCHWTYKRHDWQENAALARIGGNYPTDGRFAMNTVLSFIHVANLIPNPNTIAAVQTGLRPAWTTGCFPGADRCAPIGQTIWIRGNTGQHVTIGNGSSTLVCHRDTISNAETFTIVDAGGGRVALRGSNGRYVGSQDGASPMRCTATTIGFRERFDWLDFGDGTFGLRGSNGRFVSSENGAAPMNCDRDTPREWESFTFGIADPCGVDLAAPAGDLDFFDLIAFLAQADEDSPSAAFAMPPNVLNHADIEEFFTRAVAGCP